MKGKEKQLADQVENILTYLALAEHWRPEWLERDCPKLLLESNRVPLFEFDGARSLQGPEPGEPIIGISGLSDGTIWQEADTVDPLEMVETMGARVDYSMINASPFVLKEAERCIGYGKSPARFVLRRTRRMAIKEVRPLGIPIKSGVFFEDITAVVFADGRYDSAREILELRGRELFVVGVPYSIDTFSLANGWRPLADRSENPLGQLFLPLSFALSDEYNWKVEVRAHPNTPSVSLSASPSSIKALYKSRENFSGGTARREALRHWVKTHKRRAPSSEDELIDVLAYIRGASRFKWNGYECAIHVSDYDLKRAERLNHERQELQILRDIKRAKRSGLQNMQRPISNRQRSKRRR